MTPAEKAEFYAGFSPALVIPRTLSVGDAVRLTGSHPYAGRVAAFAGWERTPFGEVPRVSLQDGACALVMQPDQWSPCNAVGGR